MTKFYSKTTNGFYDSIINIDNIPDDAVEINDTTYKTLLSAQEIGGVISNDGANPIVTPSNVTDEKILILKQIQALENQITSRRRDEAILGVDGGWFASKRAEITALRATLPSS